MKNAYEKREKFIGKSIFQFFFRFFFLGYLVQKDELNSGNFSEEDSSIFYLATQNPEIPFEEILRGNLSFGYYMEQFGYRVVPSPLLPGPGPNLYYPGGHNLAMHSSKYSGRIDGIQIETPVEYRENPEQREVYAETIANAISLYLDLYY